MLGNDHVFWPSPAWDSLVYWALDLETGGLDPKKDAILAVGMVPVRAPSVRLGGAYARVGLRWPDPPVVDTVALLLKAAKRARLIRPDAPDHEPNLNLLAARREHGLP